MIDRFQDEYRWLSNFASVDIELDGVVYPSVEHAYQAAKTIDKDEREVIRQAKTPSQAKKLGKKVTIRKDWNKIKYAVMYNLTVQKYNQQPYKDFLLNTGDQELIEGNVWGDTYWGVCNGVGENNLGKIIMLVRDELRN